MRDFTNRAIVITGAGSGIGRELARQFADRGAILALNDRDATTLQETWDALAPATHGIKQAFDVSDGRAMERFAREVRQSLGQVDVVINNAGMSVRQRSIVKLTEEDYRRVLDVNLWGVIHGSNHFLPYLRERDEASLVNISSVFGLFAFPGSAPYNVSKFAVRGFTESLRVELGKAMHICCVHPGGIATNIAHNIDMEEGPERQEFLKNFDRQAKTTAEQAAAKIIQAIEKKKQRLLIGRDAFWIDKFARLLPASYERVLLRWFKPERWLKD